MGRPKATDNKRPKPWRRLQELASHIASNVSAHSSRVEEINKELSSAQGDETAAVVSAVAKLIEANQQMQQQLDTAEEKLQEQAKLVETTVAEARTDALTQLANRRAFDDELARHCDQFRRDGTAFTVVLADIDHFKRFNDEHGHQVGDEVLRGVAKVLRDAARKVDVVARYGGEEFVFILPGTTAKDSQPVLRRLRKAVEAANFPCGTKDLRVTMSFGAAQLLVGQSAEGVVSRADAAMYASKAAGRNCAHWYDGKEFRAVGDLEEPATQAAKPAPAETSTAPFPSMDDKTVAPPESRRERRELSNRSDFSISTGRRLAEWRRGGSRPAILLVRIDNYTDILVQQGREVAMIVLRATAQFLGAAIREMDMVAQYDESTFSLLLPGARQTTCCAVAERIRQAIARCELPAPTGVTKFTVSVSGVVTIRSDETQMLLWRAEEALDAATKAGGNCCCFYNGQRRNRQRRRPARALPTRVAKICPTRAKNIRSTHGGRAKAIQ